MSKNSRYGKFRLQVVEATALMIEKYPKAFFPKDSLETKPLMIGIFTLITGQNSQIPRPILGEFLNRYTKKNRYLRALAICSDRIDLDGNPCQQVQESHRDWAIAGLIARQQKLARKEAA